MPGMMETVLNIGLNDASVHGLAEVVGRRAVRLGLLPPADPDVRQDRARHRGRAVRRRAGRGARPRRASTSDVDLDADDLEDAGRRRSRRSCASRPGGTFPQHPREQLDLAIERGLRLVEHRPGAALPAPRADPARPGHRGERLHDGVRQPRRRLGHRRRASPATRPPGEPGVYGDYLPNAQGEDVVAGIRNTLTPGRPRASSTRRRTTQLRPVMRRLETHYRDLCDIEFTIERGKLWMLQTRVGKRTAAAAFRIADPARRRAADHDGRGARRGSPARSWPS